MAYVTNITTVITYDLDGTTNTFDIPFEYLSRSFVVVTLIGSDRTVLTVNSDYTFLSTTSIQTTVTYSPGDYTSIEVRRNTSATDRLVDFQNGSVLRANDLNTAQIQAMHIAEEARDLVGTTLGIDTNGNLDARGVRLINLADGVDPGDAVNLRQQKEWAGSALNQADRAKTEADRAQAQATIATNQATISTNQAITATTQANLSGLAATAAKSSENAAKTSETNAAASENVAFVSRNTATTAATTATTEADRAKTEADRAQSANPDNQLKKANNLSDVSSVATSRTNLSVYSKAEVDTAISDVSSRTTSLESKITKAVDGTGSWGRTRVFSVVGGVAGYSTVTCSDQVTGKWIRIGVYQVATNPGTLLHWSTPMYIPLTFNGNEVITCIAAGAQYGFDCVSPNQLRLVWFSSGAQAGSYVEIITPPLIQ